MKTSIRHWENIMAHELLSSDPYRTAEVDGDTQTVKFRTPDKASEFDVL